MQFNSASCGALATIPENRVCNDIRSGLGVNFTEIRKRYATAPAPTTIDQALQHDDGHAFGHYYAHTVYPISSRDVLTAALPSQ